MKIERNISLADKNTFRIGGPATHYAEVSSIEELQSAVAYAHVSKLDIFVLGGGSNILIGDKGFSGLVIKNNIKGIFFNEYPKTVDVTVYAGEVWDSVVEQTVAKGLQGFETLSLIPGTLGGGIVQNIGAYGSEIKDVTISVDALDARTGRVGTFINAQCAFEYRNSFFKNPEGKHFIVVSALFRLNKDTLPKLAYKDLVEKFPSHTPSLAEVRDAVIAIRNSKLPDITKMGTAGSFFKNPIISRTRFEALKKQYPETPSFPVEDEEKMKISLAWIVDKVCGLKGYRKGNVGIYEKQAICLVNYGGATQKEIDDLADHVTTGVFKKTGIRIEREVEVV